MSEAFAGTTTHDIISALCNCAYELGKQVGYAEAADNLKQRAGYFFMHEEDNKAFLLRANSQELQSKADDMYTVYKGSFGVTKYELWEELVRRMDLEEVRCAAS